MFLKSKTPDIPMIQQRFNQMIKVRKINITSPPIKKFLNASVYQYIDLSNHEVGRIKWPHFVN